MKIRFWGTRGSIAAPGPSTVTFGGNTTCLELSLASGRKIIVDAGTGMRELGAALCATDEPVDIDLLVTHNHWDHVLGFPFFPPIYQPTTTVRVDGFRRCMKGLRSTFDNQMGDGFFPVRFEDLPATIRHRDRLPNGPVEFDGVVVDTVPLHHPQGGVGFRFRDGDRRLVFLTDNELAGPSRAVHRAFCEGADVLIHDTQYTPGEIGCKCGWGHSDHQAALDLALEAGVGRLFLFHHDPFRSDTELAAIEAACRDHVGRVGASLQVEAAREGSEFQL